MAEINSTPQNRRKLAARAGGHYRFDGSDERIQLDVRVLDFRPERTIVEYRATDADLIAAGIVTADFFTPCRGRKRIDAAGRRVHFHRRRGVTHLVFSGDPLIEPLLPGVSREDIEAEREDFKISRRKYEREQQILEAAEVAAAAENTTPALYLKAAAVPIRNLVVLSGHFSPRLMNKVHEYLGRIEEQIAVETERLTERGAIRGSGSTVCRRRPSYLRLVVDNTARS